MASDDSGRGATPGSDRKKAKVVMAADIDEDELFEPKLHGYGYEYRIRYVSDTWIRTFSKNTDTGIRLG